MRSKACRWWEERAGSEGEGRERRAERAERVESREGERVGKVRREWWAERRREKRGKEGREERGIRRFLVDTESVEMCSSKNESSPNPMPSSKPNKYQFDTSCDRHVTTISLWTRSLNEIDERIVSLPCKLYDLRGCQRASKAD